MEQTKELLMLFGFEDNKINFAKFIIPYIFDIENTGILKPAFNFENSLEEIKKLMAYKLSNKN